MRFKKTKLFTIIISFLLLILGTTTFSFAATTATNWDSITKTKVGYYTMNNAAMISNDSTISLYLDNGNTANALPTENYTLTVNKQVFYLTFTITDNKVAISAINNSWQTLGTVGSGTVTSSKDKQQKITGTIALSKLGVTDKLDSLNLSNPNLGSQLITGTTTDNASDTSKATDTKNTTTNATKSSSTTSNTQADATSTVMNSSSKADSSAMTISRPNNNENGDLGITIDGNFSDWADKTKHPMTEQGDDDNIKYASLLADNKNIYFYILMKPTLSGGYTNFQPSGYQLSVGGNLFYLSFNSNQTVNLSLGETKAVSMNIYGADGATNKNLDGQAVVSLQAITQKMGDGSNIKGNGYVFECAVPMKYLKGISNTSGQTIKLANPNLWTGSLQASGGSTGPIVLASMGFVVAIGGAIKLTGFSFKKRRL